MGTLPQRATGVPDHLSAESNQDEIDQGNQGRADAGGDQGVVGADVAPRFERCSLCFVGHFERLGRAGESFCEVDHIGCGFLLRISWERVGQIRVGNKQGLGKDRKRQAMGQHLQSWRSQDGQRLWLSLLVATMEDICRPEIRGMPLNPSLLSALEAQLARPVSQYSHGRFSLRH